MKKEFHIQRSSTSLLESRNILKALRNPEEEKYVKFG